ncbi:MAG: 2-oxoglutarate oxidoreductase [Clostridiales bacterium]|jgi:2-oxoglutarate ferredoxin oxidoreductase subunit beta|nr:2-oxoglutarate oxidoreductase [Clostridiales bacterium]
MKTVFKKTSLLTDTPFHYCPGCTHGISHRLTAEAIEETCGDLGIIGIAPVGCAVFAYNYFNCDIQQAAHGRAPAVASGIKRVCPDKIVFAYQGDGDLASIGMAETVHAAARGENFTVIFINNAIYGMTGGQMAPTTLIGQKSTTSQAGRVSELQGNPIKVCEMLATLDGASYVARVSLHDLKNVMNAKKAIKRAFEYQKAKKGFSLVEVLSTCPTNWGMTPEASMDYVKEQMTKVFPLGTFKDTWEG